MNTNGAKLVLVFRAHTTVWVFRNTTKSYRKMEDIQVCRCPLHVVISNMYTVSMPCALLGLKPDHAFRLSPFAFRLSPFAFRLSPFAFRLSPFTFRLSPFTFRLSPKSCPFTVGCGPPSMSTTVFCLLLSCFTFHLSPRLCSFTAGCSPTSMSTTVFCLLLSCFTFTFHLGFVHSLQDVALHQCFPLSS